MRTFRLIEFIGLGLKLRYSDSTWAGLKIWSWGTPGRQEPGHRGKGNNFFVCGPSVDHYI